MVRLLMLAAALTFGATLHRVAVADEPKGGQAAPADPTAQLLAKLKQPLVLKTGEISLHEFASLVEKATGVGVVVNEGAFREGGIAAAEADGVMVRPTAFKGATAAAVLRYTLAKTDATFLVRRDHLEIVPLSHARRESRQPTGTDANGDPTAPYPLVSAVFREKPLNEALEQVAADHDLTILLAPQAADQKAAFVTARLLNVPADRAVELLALQADLRVVRRGAAFLVTTQGHSDQLFNERNDRKRQQIEIENLRTPPVGNFIGQPAGAIGFCGNVGVAGNLGNPGCIVGNPGRGAGIAGNPPAPAGMAGVGLAGAGPGFGGMGAFGSGPQPGGFGSGFGGFSGMGFGGSGVGFAGTTAPPPAPPAKQ